MTIAKLRLRFPLHGQLDLANVAEHFAGQKVEIIISAGPLTTSSGGFPSIPSFPPDAVMSDGEWEFWEDGEDEID